MSYWDTSALVKLYVTEPDSEQYEAFAQASQVVIGPIARHGRAPSSVGAKQKA